MRKGKAESDTRARRPLGSTTTSTAPESALNVIGSGGALSPAQGPPWRLQKREQRRPLLSFHAPATSGSANSNHRLQYAREQSESRSAFRSDGANAAAARRKILPPCRN